MKKKKKSTSKEPFLKQKKIHTYYLFTIEVVTLATRLAGILEDTYWPGL